MRTTKSRRVGSQLAVAALAVCAARVASADVSTNRPGSILIFPKVVATTTRDTIIQITNSTPLTVHTHCFYINGSIDEHTGLPQWQETDFTLWLTRQQPTHFQVSTGRPVDPSDSNKGIDPGVVPGVPSGFTGELVCVEIDASGSPIINNALTGSATLRSTSGDVAKYNGTTIHGVNGSIDSALQLNDTGTGAGEYNACPASLRVDLLADDRQDPAVQELGNGGKCFIGGTPCRTLGFCTNNAAVLCSADIDCTNAGVGGTCNSNPDCAGGADVCTPGICDAASGNPGAACATDVTCITGTCDLVNRSTVRNFLTMVPCSADFENLIPGTVTVTTYVFDEFENRLSGNPLPVTCWTSLGVQSPLLGGAANGFGSGSFVTAVITTGSSTAGVLAVAESVVTDSAGNSASTLINPMLKGSNPGDVIRLSN